MTLLDTDAVAALETVLPSRFGGSGRTTSSSRRKIPPAARASCSFVSPRVGPVDPRAVAAAFLDHVGAGGSAARVAALLWRDTGVFRVEVRAPIGERSGKVLHCHSGPPAREPAAPAGSAR